MNSSITDSFGIPLLASLAFGGVSDAPYTFNIEQISDKITFVENTNKWFYNSVGITFNDESFFAQRLMTFAEKFISNQKSLDSDDMKLLEDNLWDLV